MAYLKEDPDHLAHLVKELRALARRTDQPRETAIGFCDFGPGIAHQPALNEQIDWFYRRWVGQVEALKKTLNTNANLLDVARKVYEATDEKVRAAAQHQPAGGAARNR